MMVFDELHSSMTDPGNLCSLEQHLVLKVTQDRQDPWKCCFQALRPMEHLCVLCGLHILSSFRGLCGRAQTQKGLDNLLSSEVKCSLWKKRNLNSNLWLQNSNSASGPLAVKILWQEFYSPLFTNVHSQSPPQDLIHYYSGPGNLYFNQRSRLSLFWEHMKNN